MNAVVTAVINRLREPSSMAGIAAIVTMLGLPSNENDAIMKLIGGIAGILAVFIPEGSAPAAPPSA